MHFNILFATLVAATLASVVSSDEGARMHHVRRTASYTPDSSDAYGSPSTGSSGSSYGGMGTPSGGSPYDSGYGSPSTGSSGSSYGGMGTPSGGSPYDSGYGSSGLGYFPTNANQLPPGTDLSSVCSYAFNAATGLWTLSGIPKISGCPFQVDPHTSVPTNQQYDCQVQGSKAPINIGLFDCGALCILAKKCDQYKSCNVQADDSLISIHAFDCGALKILS